MQTIVEETVGIVKNKLGKRLETITIEQAVVGLFFTAIKISSGQVGSCATPIKEIPEAVCCPSSAMAMPFPGKLRGRPVAHFLNEAVEQKGIRRAVGLAALNALAELTASEGKNAYQLKEDVDAFDAAQILPTEKVVVVGAFGPFLRALRKMGADYQVLEMDPSTLKPEELPFYRPATMMRDVVPQADVLLVTGTTLVNDTLEDILKTARSDARVAVVGPTVLREPQAFFDRGCTIVGGVRVVAPDEYLMLLMEGGSGYHFLGKSAKKIVMIRP